MHIMLISFRLQKIQRAEERPLQNICEKHWRQVTQNQKEEFTLSYLFCPTTNITFWAR